MLDRLDLAAVTVIGNSFGGWLAAEIALQAGPRVSGAVIIAGIGIDTIPARFGKIDLAGLGRRPDAVRRREPPLHETVLRHHDRTGPHRRRGQRPVPLVHARTGPVHRPVHLQPGKQEPPHAVRGRALARRHPGIRSRRDDRREPCPCRPDPAPHHRLPAQRPPPRGHQLAGCGHRTGRRPRPTGEVAEQVAPRCRGPEGPRAPFGAHRVRVMHIHERYKPGHRSALTCGNRLVRQAGPRRRSPLGRRRRASRGTARRCRSRERGDHTIGPPSWTPQTPTRATARIGLLLLGRLRPHVLFRRFCPHVQASGRSPDRSNTGYSRSTAGRTARWNNGF
nr:hypothetical protein [Streptomyces sp. NRRL B-1677]